MGGGSWTARLTLAGISLLVAFLGIEAGMMALGLFAPPDNPLQTSRPDLYQADPYVGYRLWPSREMTYRYPADGELITLVSNSDGLRNDRELNEADMRTRMLVVGDSFVFGEGVREDKRFTEVLEELEPGWRVDNLGMPGWGLDLMVRALERYGSKADPDVVVLAVYTNDLRRLVPEYAGAGFAYPKFELVGSELHTIPYQYPALWERSRIVQGLKRAYWAGSCDVGVGRFHRDRNRYDISDALLNRYLSKTKDGLGADPVVMFIPGRAPPCEDQKRREFLRSWAFQRGVPYLDLTQVIHGAGVDTVYIKPEFPFWPPGSEPLYTNTPLRPPDFFIARCSAPS